MDYINLGRTGLKVSRICLGCMSYGEPQRGMHAWTLPEADSRPFIARALEHGINFFDTANVYSAGSSEEIVGRALRDMVPRDEIVLATKVHGQMRADANGRGLSRKAILTEIDASLTRLGMDYVDLYQIHRFDPETPIEETLEALHDVVRAGKARYIGASSMYAWQFCKALYLSRLHGWARFVSMQNHYNLLYREEEREMLALCAEEGIGVIPWSPLARGLLTRPPTAATPTTRAGTDQFTGGLRHSRRARHAARTDSPRLGPRPPRCHRPHHRRHQNAPPRRRRRRPDHQTNPRRNRPAGIPLPAESRRRLLAGRTAVGELHPTALAPQRT
jgi:aryl-alcohol dehydrogenase-like predicted oxidoreductase